MKALAKGETQPRKAESGKTLTPPRLVEIVRELSDGWRWDALSIGYPGLVGRDGPSSEPANLGPGWVGFDYTAAFGKPVRMMNDGAMQALGSYDGRRMLFVGLGTSVGSALIQDDVILTLELGALAHGDGKLSHILGREGRKRLGREAWGKAVLGVLPALMAAFGADYVVAGGGGAKDLDPDRLPAGVRQGSNLTAFRGGYRLWELDGVPTLSREPSRATSRRRPRWRVL